MARTMTPVEQVAYNDVLLRMPDYIIDSMEPGDDQKVVALIADAMESWKHNSEEPIPHV